MRFRKNISKRLKCDHQVNRVFEVIEFSQSIKEIGGRNEK